MYDNEQSSVNTKSLQQRIQNEIGAQRIMYAEDSFCTLTYPLLLDIARNPKGKDMLGRHLLPNLQQL